MSHSTPGQAYAYTPPAPAEYYYEQPRDFVGDFSESEGSPRLLVPPNVTEIYRRKSMAQHFRQSAYAPSSYYYEAVPQVSPPVRRPASYRHPMDDRSYFYTAAGEDDYTALVFDPPQREGMAKSPRGVAVARQVVRRQHPVTVRTPKYYRKPTIYKKPSALCLPLSCQPDPAISRKAKRSSEEPSYTPSQPIESQEGEQSKPVARTHSLPDATNGSQEAPHRVDHSGDAQTTQVDVDSLLAQYENILGNTAKKSASTSSKLTANGIPSKQSVLSMKPKVPPSLKGKQSSLEASGDQNEQAKEERIEVEEITTEILDSMLSELIESGCENKLEDAEKAESPRKRSLFSEKHLRPQSAMPKLEVSSSFNYQDLSKNFSKSQHELLTDGPSNSTPTDSPRGEFKDPKQPAEEEHVCGENCRSPDEHTAIELHRSKSYIVNLIDRALSKELGTVPDDRMPSVAPCGASAAHPNEKERQRARKAIDLINKNIDKMDQGLCLEITQAITDSILSKATSPCAHSVKHCACTCPVQEEPLYVKQLKQLRWGHLKHIQREVRRLEDLEKFLDSCTSGTQ